MASPLVQARVSESLEDRIEDYAENSTSMSKSDAVRELIVRGLEVEDTGGPSATGLTDGTLRTVAVAFLAVSLMLSPFNLGPAAALPAAISVVLFGVAIAMEIR